jgi:hypothetical protein
MVTTRTIVSPTKSAGYVENTTRWLIDGEENENYNHRKPRLPKRRRFLLYLTERKRQDGRVAVLTKRHGRFIISSAKKKFLILVTYRVCDLSSFHFKMCAVR